MDKIDLKQYMDGFPKPSVKEKANTGHVFDTDEVWKIVSENLRLSLGHRDYSAWVDGMYLEKIENGVAVFSCSEQFKKERILKNHIRLFKKYLLDATGENLAISIEVKPSGIKKSIKKIQYEYHDPTGGESLDLFSASERQERMKEEAVKSSQLNPKYRFDNFIVGTNNRLAEAVGRAVVENLGLSYNPVFYYGETGVGKTHLMQAIGNEVIANDPAKKVVYVSIERFLNELIESIRTNKQEDFRNKYREVDLLIIDDVQFVENYPKTQEELFHTFNTLHQANKQIILASDRPPRELKNISDRLRSRFQGGMVADLQAPDYETRMAILKQLAGEKKAEIPEDFQDLIAKNIDTNIRELEGALTKVISLINLGEKLTEEDIAKMLQIDIDSKRKRITPAKIISVVSEVFGVTVGEIKGKRRTSYVALSRQVVMYLLRSELDLPLERAAREVNREDHTTVLHACEKIEKLKTTDSRFKDKLQKCIKGLSV
jgi:chromosomal replication initiator protein